MIPSNHKVTGKWGRQRARWEFSKHFIGYRNAGILRASQHEKTLRREGACLPRSGFTLEFSSARKPEKSSSRMLRERESCIFCIENGTEVELFGQVIKVACSILHSITNTPPLYPSKRCIRIKLNKQDNLHFSKLISIHNYISIATLQTKQLYITLTSKYRRFYE